MITIISAVLFLVYKIAGWKMAGAVAVLAGLEWLVSRDPRPWREGL